MSEDIRNILPDEPERRPETWHKPGVTPDGHRTGSSTDGPRIAMDGESEPDAERYGADDIEE
jgi:hypothetical protein